MTSLIDILREYGIPYRTEGQHHHTREGWVQIECPFCGKGSGGYHLGINLEHFYCSCWRCGYHSLFVVLKEVSGQDYDGVKRRLDGMIPVYSTTKRSAGQLELPKGIGPLGGVHKRYLQGRKLDPDQIASQWGVRGIGLASQLAWRLFIPVHRHGEIVSWTTRSVGGGKRYISAKPKQSTIPLSHLLYGADQARHSVVVVEGPADVWRIGPGAVATFGLIYSTAQVRAIAQFPVRGVCFDSELVAQKRARKLCSALSGFPGRTELVELDSDDPGSASEEEISEIRKAFF